MEQNVLVSVIVPVYNVEQYLPRCVDSILAQTYENLEVILVDDGTKDASDKLCDAYAEQDPRVKVIHKENGGLSSARNAGIDIARGEYLAFVDSDDWVEPDTYGCMLELARKYDVKLVCAGRYDVSSGTGEKTVGLCPRREEVVSGEELVRRIFVWENVDSAAWDKLYHRSLFREIRYPVGKICEDVPTTYRLALDAGKAAMCDRPFYNYFHRPGSITTASVSAKTFHFSEHTEAICAFIREKYPQIEREARYFRVRSLVYNVQMLDIAGEEAKTSFAEQYRKSRSGLREQIPFILTCPYFSRRERVTNTLLALGGYGALRSLYHRIKGAFRV